MRVSAFYLAIVIGSSMQLLLASSGNGQSIDDIKVTVGLSKGESLEKLFKAIEKQSDLFFAFDYVKVNQYTNIRLQKTTRTIRETLDAALIETPFLYRQVKNNVVVFQEGEDPEIFLVNKDEETLLASIAEMTRPLRVTGTVRDVAGGPMAGVNIIEKGTANGTSSDSDGNYSINVANNATLTFSFIGYQTYEIEIGDRAVIDIVLNEDVSLLNEVVVNAGYYDVKKALSTGNIAKVTAKEIEQQPVTNPLAALQGRVTGVYVQQASGTPGGEFRIRIRGRNSLRDDGNEPLYIVDGIPFSMEKTFSHYANPGGVFAGADSQPRVARINPLTSINTADIESIEILKDADATSLYGSRGANGVVLITTKKARAGKTKFDLNIYSGVGRVRKIDFLNTKQYLAIRKEAFANDGLIPSANPDDDGSPEHGYRLYAPDLMVWDTTRYIDWQEVFFGSAQTTSVQNSISGGNEHTRFIFSMGYRRENSVYPGDLGYQKGSFHLGSDHQSANRKFKINASVIGSKDRNDQPVIGLVEYRNLPPNAPSLYDEYGDLNWGNSTWYNPLAFFELEYRNDVVSILGNAVIEYELVHKLYFKTSFGLSYLNSKERNKTPLTYYDPNLGYTSAQSEVRDAVGNNHSWSIEPQLNWEKEIGGGKLAVLIGSTFQEQQLERKADYYRGFPSDALMDNLASASQTYNLEYVKSLYRYSALFGRLNYNWKEKYILNLTGRRDGSSRFGPHRQFANFGAIGAAWIFSNESFIKNNISIISFGKLRTSYGSTGNDQIGNYQYLDTYAPSAIGANQYQGVTTLSPTKLFNADYAWEVNKKFEAALEVGFLKDRISLAVSFFRNISSSQLVEYTLPQTTGFSGILANFPATVRNIGVEFELTTVNVQSNGVQWTTSLNITIPRNILLAFPNIESSTYANRYVVGEPLSIQKRFESTGVDPETGAWTFRDVNGDGQISDPEDLTRIMFSGQDLFGGLNNSITYKGWSLDFLFQFVKQTGSGFLTGGMPGRSDTNVLEASIKKTIWRNPGDDAEVQKLFTNNNAEAGRAYASYRRSDAVVGDASFIRLKNLSLSYQFPAKWTQRFDCRLYFLGQNLLTITGYEADDPENLEYYTLPPLRMFTAGIQVTI